MASQIYHLTVHARLHFPQTASRRSRKPRSETQTSRTMDNISNDTGNGTADGIAGVIVIPRDYDNLALCAIVTVVMQMSFYLVACTCKIDTVTDFAGSTNFVVLAVLTFGLSGTYNARQIVLTVLVILWGIRLGSYLLIRIIKTGKDERFNKVRDNPIKFLIFWIFQIVWVYTVSLPVMFVNSPVSPQVPFGPADYVGAFLFAFGLLIEFIADTHKFVFRNDPANKGKWMDRGLWKISRHPNYLGEIVLWWGAFIISASILQGGRWTAVISPLFLMLILIFGTGIPPLERGSDRKYGHNPDYIEYKKSTPPLIFGIPPLYRVTPYVLKLIFCCEFPFYFMKQESEDIEGKKRDVEPDVVEKQPLQH